MSTTTHLMTAEELILLHDGLRHELIKGELLTLSPAGADHGAKVMNLSAPLAVHVKRNSLGVVFTAETGFKLESDPDTVLAPDIAFVSKERVTILPVNYWDITPDLVVEVISPSDSKREIKLKTQRWLEFGARLVWLVRPKTKTVEVHRPNSNYTLTERDVLSGEEVVAGFQIPVSEIFD